MKEDAPTNSMSGVYSLNAPGHRVGPKDKAQIFYPDVDGNFTDGIPGNPGDPFYVRPEGYWKGGNQWSEQEVPDASQEYLDNDPTGKSTGDLIAEDGTVKTFLPPDSRHFILGPLVDGYVVNHGYDNYSNIGYIQKDTRQFVLLARIQGQFTADLHQEGARVWDGTSEQLTIYNSNFTLAMAEWFRDQITGGKSTSNVPYFYSGGVPQQPLNILQCPSCPPNMFGGVTPGTGGGFGQGTPPSLGSQQAASQSGNQQQAKIFNLTPDQAKTLAVLLGLGLSIAAVVAVLFPEPSSSAAGAAFLAGKFRFGASLKRAFSNIWKAKPKTYKKIEYPKPSADDILLRNVNRATQRPIQPRTSTRTNPKKRFPVGDSYDHITDIKLKLILETYDKALLNEVAPTGSGVGGGTELADVYVDQVSQDYDADQLQQASDDANDLAGDQGLTDEQKSDIDKQAEDLAKELNNVDHSRPESMTAEQIENFYDMAFSVDPEWMEQNFDRFESLIDKEAVDKAYGDYKLQREYLSSEDYYRTFSGYAENKDKADAIWPFLRGYETKYENKTYDSSGKLIGYSLNVYKGGVQVVDGDAVRGYWDKLSEWADAYTAHYDIFNNVIQPAKRTALDSAFETYSNASIKAFRAFDMAMIKAWSQREVLTADAYDNYNWLWKTYGIDAAEWYLKNTDKPMQQNPYIPEGGYIPLDLAKDDPTKSDPFSLTGVTPGEIASSSNEKKKKKKKDTVVAHYEPKFLKNREREVLSETRTPKQRRILREIKQPVKVKEAPTKYKMNFSGKYSPQNTPSATSSPESDALVASGNEKGRKWREEDKYWSGYETTERMNVIHDRVGHGSQYWDRMLDEAKSKNNWRNREMQEELNKIAHEKAMLKENPEYRSPFGDGVEVEDTTTKNVQNFEKVTKIKKVVADTKVFNNKEIKPEYPDDENKEKDRMLKMAKQMTPEMEKMKKEFEGPKAQTGENAAARYKRLDPISAKSMPDAAYPQIDALRDQAKKKLKTFENFDNPNKKKLYEKIATQETKYLRYFVENFSVPKYYDWESGEFNELAEINKVVLKRLGTIEDALSEGMTTKAFKYLYGGVVTHDIVSLNPNLVSSTFAQDLIGASSQVTSHMFGPDFPGSHINSIGDFKPQSYSKVDVLATASWNSLQDVTPDGWTPDNSYEYVNSVSDVVTSGQETDVFKDTLFGEVTVTGTDFSLSTGDDEDHTQENTVDIEDLKTLFPGVTFPTGHPMPDGTEPEDPMEASMLLRTFKSIKVGQEISFNYSFTSAETEEESDGVTYRGVPDTDTPGDDGIMDDYAFVLIAGRVQKIVSVMAKDGNNLDFNFQADGSGYYKPDILQSRFPLTGKYSYTVTQDDIDDHGNLKLFVGVMDVGDSNYESNLDITDFEIGSKRSDAGQLGQTTDAFDLGYRAQTPEELRKLLQSSEIASDIEKLGTQFKTYRDYLTGNLPDTIDNEYLGQKYVNSIFKDAYVNNKGKISVGDNVVGTGGEATYDPKTGQITIPFNYDFNTNAQEIAKNPERFGNSAFDKTVRAIATILGGDYALDSLPVVPAGYATALAKLLGGAKHRPGKVTMSADKVNKLNPLLHAQVVGTTGLAKEELYPGQPSPNGFPDTPPPKMINGRHPEFGKRSNRYRRLDPISAKTMSMVKTGDPETDKQVNDQAKKPKVEGDSTWSKLKKYR